MTELKSADNVSRLPDYTNEDVVRRILESGDESELKRFQAASGLSAEQIAVYAAFAKMRKQVHEAMAVELAAREAANHVPTQEELSAGLFREMLEPQVRQAVFTLRQKGYPTYESGFFGLGASQRISVASGAFKDAQISQGVMAKLADKGIEVSLAPDRIELNFNKVVSLAEIQEAWRLISEDLPDLGQAAELSNLPAAKSFRAKFKN